MWSREELSWMAGLYEGEGCLVAPKRNSPMRLQISSTDQDTVWRFYMMAGMGWVRGPNKPTGLGKKNTYRYEATGAVAYAIAAALWTHLCARRRKQIKKAFDAYAALKHYRSLDPDDVATIKKRLREGGRGTGRELAKQFGVTDGLISAIKHERAWSSL